MKATTLRTKPNRQIIDEASAWFVDFRVGDVDTEAREEFNTWLRRSPEHIQAYLDVASIYAELPALSGDGKHELDVEELIARARASADVTLLPSTGSASHGSLREMPRMGSRRFPLALAAAILLAIAGTWLYSQRGMYSTGVGEQRSIILADGSTVGLNARSRMQIRFSKHERGVDLLEGQAFFEVARDPDRPFIVRSDETQVRAVGTQFDVYRKRQGTVVTVVEGRVAVLGMAKEAEVSFPTSVDAPIFLAAGEQLTVTSAAIEPPTVVDTSVAVAWTQRRLVFENTPLSDVADEFNRYSTRTMVVDAAGLEDFHVSGTYSSANPESLLRFLRAQPGLRVTETDREIRIEKK